MSRKYFERFFCRFFDIKKTGSNGYVYDFSIDYDAIAVNIRQSQVFNKKNNNML